MSSPSPSSPVQRLAEPIASQHRVDRALRTSPVRDHPCPPSAHPHHLRWEAAGAPAASPAITAAHVAAEASPTPPPPPSPAVPAACCPARQDDGDDGDGAGASGGNDHETLLRDMPAARNRALTRAAWYLCLVLVFTVSWTLLAATTSDLLPHLPSFLSSSSSSSSSAPAHEPLQDFDPAAAPGAFEDPHAPPGLHPDQHQPPPGPPVDADDDINGSTDDDFAGADSSSDSDSDDSFSWSRVTHIFAFGDSYTSTWFSPSSAPAPVLPAFPLGNRAREPIGKIYDGPKWLEQLATRFNETPLLAYNLAVGGATVARDVIGPSFVPSTFDEQIADSWKPLYSSASADIPWSSRRSLFIAWFGINDANISFLNRRRLPIGELMARYRELLDDVRNSGRDVDGRPPTTFLVLNVPPIDVLHDDAPGTELEREDIVLYNDALRLMLSEFAHAHLPSINVFLLNVHSLWSTAITSPKKFPETANVTVTQGWCDAYVPGTPDLDSFDESCKVPVDQYVWQNNLHATWVMGNLTAAEAVRACFGVDVGVSPADGGEVYCEVFR